VDLFSSPYKFRVYEPRFLYKKNTQIFTSHKTVVKTSKSHGLCAIIKAHGTIAKIDRSLQLSPLQLSFITAAVLLQTLTYCHGHPCHCECLHVVVVLCFCCNFWTVLLFLCCCCCLLILLLSLLLWFFGHPCHH
jgi:hypothetical protein